MASLLIHSLSQSHLDENKGSRCISLHGPYYSTVVSLGAADFELEELRGKLDEQGLAIAEKQEASVNSRKKLAETTKGGRLLGVLHRTYRR